MGKHDETIWIPEVPDDDEKPPAVVPVPSAPQPQQNPGSEEVERLEPDEPQADRQA